MNRIHAQEVLVVKERDTFIFPCASGMMKLSAKMQKFAHPIKFGKDPRRWKETGEHPGEDGDESDLAEQKQHAMNAKKDF